MSLFHVVFNIWNVQRFYEKTFPITKKPVKHKVLILNESMSYIRFAKISVLDQAEQVMGDSI